MKDFLVLLEKKQGREATIIVNKKSESGFSKFCYPKLLMHAFSQEKQVDALILAVILADVNNILSVKTERKHNEYITLVPSPDRALHAQRYNVSRQ